MNFVEPIRDKRVLEDLLSSVKKESERDYIMMLTGFYSGFRISDLLKLRIEDVYNKKSFDVVEGKTGNKRKIPVNPVLKKELDSYCRGKDPDEYLIKSRQGYNKPISRDMAYKIIKRWGENFGLYNLGTHSMRKTFGYHYYKDSKGDIETLRRIYGHAHWSITIRYIGINQETINAAIYNFRY